MYTRPNTAMVATAVASTKPTARRTAEERKNSSIRVQHETRPADIDDQRRRALCVNFLPQVANVNVNDVGLKRKVILPYLLEQHRPGDDPSGMPEKVFHEPELARQQIDPGAA